MGSSDEVTPSVPFAKRVIPARIEAPADGIAAEGPAVAALVRVTLAVGGTLVAAVLRRLGAVADAKGKGAATTIGVGLLTALFLRGHSRAVCEARVDVLCEGVAHAVTAAILAVLLAAHHEVMLRVRVVLRVRLFDCGSGVSDLQHQERQRERGATVHGINTERRLLVDVVPSCVFGRTAEADERPVTS